MLLSKKTLFFSLLEATCEGKSQEWPLARIYKSQLPLILPKACIWVLLDIKHANGMNSARIVIGIVFYHVYASLAKLKVAVTVFLLLERKKTTLERTPSRTSSTANCLSASSKA